MASTKSDVRKWMYNNADDYMDACNELDCTGLAEACADAFDLYEDDADATIPEWVFDMAVDTETVRKEGMQADADAARDMEERD